MKNKERFDWSEHFSFGENTPLFSSVIETEKTVTIIEESIKSIKQAKSARYIIVETWLILDYFMRRFIVSGLNVDGYSTEKLDIASELLPQGFRGCLIFLKKLIKDQQRLSINPKKNVVNFPVGFSFFIAKEQKDFHDKYFIPVVKKYYEKYHPALVGEAKTFKEFEDEIRNRFSISATAVSTTANANTEESAKKYREVSEGWLKIAQKFDSRWFENAEKLNKLRNFASHDIDSKRVYSELGINGKNEQDKFKKLKNFCLKQLSNLLDIKVQRRIKKKLA